MIKAFFKSLVSAIFRNFRRHRRPGPSQVINPASPLVYYRVDHGFSLNIDTPMHFAFGSRHEPRIAKVVSPCRKIDKSLAVVKDSENPYLDFKSSMQQMVFDKEIDTESDLEELLKCFLKMNSPPNHRAIARAFMETWDEVCFGHEPQSRPCV